MDKATRALGTVLKKGKTNPITIGGLKEIGGVDMSADTIDVTTLSSNGGFKDFIAGFKDAGEVSFSGFFDPSDDGQTAIINSFLSGNKDDFSIVFPISMGAQWDFEAIVTKIKTDAKLEDPVGFEGSLKIIGAPTLTLNT